MTSRKITGLTVVLTLGILIRAAIAQESAGNRAPFCPSISGSPVVSPLRALH
jgi:hypothetical protein